MQTRLTRREVLRGGALAAAATAAGVGSYVLLKPKSSPRLDQLRVNARHTGFVGAASGHPFTAWGFNWGGPGEYRDLDAVEDRFSEMRSLGANTVRVHLQFADLMESPTRPSGAALAHLASILDIAERQRLYLDISGNEVWLPATAPHWYDSLAESARWAAQAVYWGAVAQVCAGSPAVFCYDLLSEPIVGNGVAAGQWYTGKFGRFYFGQLISLQLAGRQPSDVARTWIERLTRAIRAHDSDHLITVGLLPNAAWSGFDPVVVAPLLDFLSVHVYPRTGHADESVALVQQLATHGKPVLVEETYTLAGDGATVEQFIFDTRPYAAGWLSSYSGKSMSQLSGSQDFSDLLQRKWLKFFQKNAPRLARTPPS